jgi:hypothetical protein
MSKNRIASLHSGLIKIMQSVSADSRSYPPYPTASVNEIGEFFELHSVTDIDLKKILVHSSNTPLHVALEHRQDNEVCKFLVDIGANVGVFLIEMQNELGQTPLMCALQTAREFNNKWKTLVTADLIQNEKDTVHMLLGYCSHDVMLMQDSRGWSALHIACATDHARNADFYAQFLQDKCPDAWALKNKNGNTPIALFKYTKDKHAYKEISAAAIVYAQARAKKLQDDKRLASAMVVAKMTGLDISGISRSIAEMAGIKKVSRNSGL